MTDFASIWVFGAAGSTALYVESSGWILISLVLG